MLSPWSSRRIRRTVRSLDCKSDCQSVVVVVKSLRVHCTEKRLYLDVDVLREVVETGELRSLQLMPADEVTKPQPKLQGGYHRRDGQPHAAPKDGGLHGVQVQQVILQPLIVCK
jgi:hypothetical protein